MSKVAIKGADTGTGVFTLESPATNTDRTLTLPDNTGTILTSGAPVTVAQGGTGRTTALAEAAITLTSNSSAGADNTYVKVNFNSAPFDNYSGFSTGQYTIPVTGVYALSTTVYFRQASGGTANQFIVRFYKNGTAFTYVEVDGNGASVLFHGMAVTSTWNGSLSAGDVITVYGLHSYGSAANTYNFVGNGCTLNIRQLS